MVKVSSSDIIAVLRRYEVAGEENVPRHVSMVSFSNPSPTNTLISFRFAKQQYYILFDDTAEDDVEFVMSQIRTDKQDAAGEVITNPNDHRTTYALPFKGKELYLFLLKSPKTRLDLELSTRYP